MRTSIFLLLSILFFTSCTKDNCKREITYMKAVPILGDLESFRKPIVNEAPRALEQPHKILITSNLLIVSEKEVGIHVIDNIEPENPQSVNFIDIPGISDMNVQGNTLFARTHYDILELDISDAENIRLLNRHEAVFPVIDGTADQSVVTYEVQEVTESMDCSDGPFVNGQWLIFNANGLEIPIQDVPVSFVGSMSSGSSELQFGTLNRMAIIDEYIYYIDYSNIYVFEKSGSSVQLIQQVSSPFIMETIYPSNGQLYIGARTGMIEYSLIDPTNPQIERVFEHFNTCDPVLPHNEVAYITLRSGDACNGDINQLMVADLSRNDNQPWNGIVFTTEMDNPHGMAIQDNFLYVAEGTFGMKIFDITRADFPSLYREETGFTAYDLINHPSDPDILISAGPDGITQFEVVDGQAIQMLSQLSY